MIVCLFIDYFNGHLPGNIERSWLMFGSVLAFVVLIYADSAPNPSSLDLRTASTTSPRSCFDYLAPLVCLKMSLRASCGELARPRCSLPPKLHRTQWLGLLLKASVIRLSIALGWWLTLAHSLNFERLLSSLSLMCFVILAEVATSFYNAFSW